MKSFLDEILGIWHDGKRDYHAILAIFYLFMGILILPDHTVFGILFTLVDFSCVAFFGTRFWRDTENSRLLRRWRRRNSR
jgi:hypothetical protein